MTQEQKDKIEQAAHDHAKQYRSQVSLEGMENISSDFKAGAQTILDNPKEWGLCDRSIHTQAVETFNKITTDALDALQQCSDERNAMQPHLSRYREALVEITRVFGNPISSEIAKEALKNNEG